MGCNLCSLQKREEHYKLLYEISQVGWKTEHCYTRFCVCVCLHVLEERLCKKGKFILPPFILAWKKPKKQDYIWYSYGPCEEGNNNSTIRGKYEGEVWECACMPSLLERKCDHFVLAKEKVPGEIVEIGSKHLCWTNTGMEETQFFWQFGVSAYIWAIQARVSRILVWPRNMSCGFSQEFFLIYYKVYFPLNLNLWFLYKSM